MPKVHLKKNEERRIKAGHLWVFSNEIEKIEYETVNGDIINVYDYRGNYLGAGFYNKNSLISIRMLYDKPVNDFYSFAKEKILASYKMRKLFYPDRESFRLLFGESDFMPGLIIDKYKSTFVLQINSFGMERNIKQIVRILKEDLNAENIFTKNEEYFRKLEGLETANKIYLGEIKEEVINDGTLNFKINFEKGHKTGFYFDQSDNRFFIRKIVKDKNVIDAFCNAGGFGLHASQAGAASVTFIDSSSNEIENSKINFELNDLKAKSEFIVSDVFDYFENEISQNKKYDVVMIDPPSFAKNKRNLPAAKKGYERLNKLALQLIDREGFLVTSSCSHHLKKEDFIQVINSAAIKADKKIQLIHFNNASLDHPQIPAMEETSYLKFAVVKIVK